MKQIAKLTFNLSHWGGRYYLKSRSQFSIIDDYTIIYKIFYKIIQDYTICHICLHFEWQTFSVKC